MSADCMSSASLGRSVLRQNGTPDKHSLAVSALSCSACSASRAARGMREDSSDGPWSITVDFTPATDLASSLGDIGCGLGENTLPATLANAVFWGL